MSLREEAKAWTSGSERVWIGVRDEGRAPGSEGVGLVLVSLEELSEPPFKVWKRPLWPESWVSIDRQVAVSQNVEKADLRELRGWEA